MKKTILILLALTMALVLAACVSVKVAETPLIGDPEPAPAITEAPTAAPTAQPTAEPTVEPTPEPTPEPTAEPTPEPTPEPTEVPLAATVAAANEKLKAVQSLHMDMDMAVDMDMALNMGEMKQTIPVTVRMTIWMDMTRDPDLIRGEIAITAMNETTEALIYGAREGDNVVTYISPDKGVTWQKQTDVWGSQTLAYPSDTIDLLLGQGMELKELGTMDVNGKPAAVYTGKVDGKMLQEILGSTGAMESMGETLNADLSADTLSKLGDMVVTFMIDEESGLPVRYAVDMGAAMKDLLDAVMAESRAGESMESVEIDMDVTNALLTITLSDFDAVAPITIPEAALNAPEA